MNSTGTNTGGTVCRGLPRLMKLNVVKTLSVRSSFDDDSFKNWSDYRNKYFGELEIFMGNQHQL